MSDHDDPAPRRRSRPAPSSEAVLERATWRTRSAEPGAPWGAGAAGSPPVLEREVALDARRRISRAVAVPALAGAVVFVVAVLVAISVTMLRSDGSGALEAEAAGAARGASAPAGAGAPGTPGTSGAPTEAADTALGPGRDASAGAAGAAEAASVAVHVVGEVARPGVVELAGGSRVSDAVEAAGGPTGAAVLDALNLARAVVDGEQIVVPDAAQAEAGLPGAGAAGSGTASAGPEQPGAGSSAPAPGAGGLVDLNTADAAALETLPRVGPALAQRIIDWRAANGRFASVDQLLEVAGIGAKTLEGLRDRVRV